MRLTSGIKTIESLEGRLFLSASVSGLTAADIAQLQEAGRSAVRLARHLPQLKLSSDLASLAAQESGGQQPTVPLSLLSQGNLPGVTIHVRGQFNVIVHRLEKMGFVLSGTSKAERVIDGYLPISSLDAAASLRSVASIESLPKPTVNSVGLASNQADQAMDVQVARSLYGLDGTGVKIGVISDSVSQAGSLQDSVATGDLPNNVVVLQDGVPGDTDEGRAMLEEIHDLAPGASLYFHTGGVTQTAMASAVTALQNAGCKIIVDDLGFSDEPYFQDGLISRAITTFVNAGGSYFSAVGNDGGNGYLRTNVQYCTPSKGQVDVNFASTGTADPYLRFTLSNSAMINFEWDNPYDGVVGHANSELDMYIYNFNRSELVTSSTNDSLASGIPLQSVYLGPGTYNMRLQLSALASGATAPDMIKFIAAAETAGTLAYVDYPGIVSTAYGHSSGTDTISVGAVPFSSAPPFSTATPIANENFSSVGPVIYKFDSNGNPLPAPQTLDKPDVSGVDGVNTSFFGYVTPTDPTYLPQFFGTSAAAPNVAAIAALVDQYRPGTTESQMLAALEASATPLNGSRAGTWNPQGGYGLVDAEKTLQYFGAAGITPIVTLATVASPRTTPLASETISFNESVTGFNATHLSLTRNGGSNLLTSQQTLSSSTSQIFTLNNLSAITATPGVYTLSVTASGGAIVGDGMTLTAGDSVTWTVTAPAAAPTAILTPVVSPRTSSFSEETITFNEPVSGFTLADLVLTRNGGSNLLSSAQTLTTTNQQTFALNNLGSLTSVAGAYTLTLKPGSITGSGVSMAAGDNISWVVNSTVAGRYLFYNNSIFDRYYLSGGAVDDQAIAPDKSALLPGQTATFKNYSSYNKGLNGIMVDIAGLPASSLLASDFVLRTGNSNQTSTWSMGPTPVHILVRPGAGAHGSSRVELIWNNYQANKNDVAVAGKWLQITVKADADTGLAVPDVFYFGNAPGSTGVSSKSAAVTSADVAAISAHQTSLASITDAFDINRNGIVSSYDAELAQGDETTGSSALMLITPH